MFKHLSSKKNPNNDIYFYVYTFIIFGLTLISCLVWEARTSGLSLLGLVVQFKNSLYFPHHNIFGIGEIGDVTALKLFYKFLLLTIFITVAYYILFFNKKKHTLPAKIVTIIGLTGLLLFAGVQQAHRFKHFIHEKNKFGGKTIDEKQFALFGQEYDFSKICRKIFPGVHQGKLVTDLDLSESLHMSSHRILSYHLYPNISLRFDNRSPKDCLILFYKQDPQTHIPENYNVLFTSEDNNYTLALRENPAE